MKSSLLLPNSVNRHSFKPVQWQVDKQAPKLSGGVQKARSTESDSAIPEANTRSSTRVAHLWEGMLAFSMLALLISLEVAGVCWFLSSLSNGFWSELVFQFNPSELARMYG